MIKVEQLTKKYGTVTALDNLNLTIPDQMVSAVLGPNGAGKTTTIRILSTLTLPTSGRASINGFDVVKQPVQAKQQIGVVHQTLNLDPELTAYESMLIHGMMFGMSRDAIRHQSDELLAFVGLSDQRKRRVVSFSGGMKRRLTIARALIHDPSVVILDEPTVGLDVHTRRKVWALIRGLKEKGASVLLTTHYIEEAQQLADTAAIIDHGRLVALGAPEELISKVGNYALDIQRDNDFETLFFCSQEEATAYLARKKGSGTVREASLEDVFISLTGRRVQPESRHMLR